jgi:hypothetical protein
MTEPAELVKQLRSGELRCRTGIVLLPDDALGHEADVAARLDVQHVDFTEHMIAQVPPGSQVVDLTLGRIFASLDDIVDSTLGMNCVLVSAFDVAVMRLTSKERAELWRRLLSDFPYRKKGLLLGIPGHLEGILVLQEETIRKDWQDAGRIARWTD